MLALFRSKNYNPPPHLRGLTQSVVGRESFLEGTTSTNISCLGFFDLAYIYGQKCGSTLIIVSSKQFGYMIKDLEETRLKDW